MTRQEAFHKYVDLNIWIRELSSPGLSDAVSAEEYGKLLVRSFTRIGDISRLSLDIMSNILTPVLISDNRLTPEERDSLRRLEEEMLDAFSMDNLDISLSYLVSMRLYEDAGRNAEHVQYLAAYRCAYLAGELSAEEYRNRLTELTSQADDKSMTYDDAILHTSVPLEYILNWNSKDGMTPDVTFQPNR